eukprot:RCo020917
MRPFFGPSVAYTGEFFTPFFFCDFSLLGFPPPTLFFFLGQDCIVPVSRSVLSVFVAFHDCIFFGKKKLILEQEILDSLPFDKALKDITLSSWSLVVIHVCFSNPKFCILGPLPKGTVVFQVAPPRRLACELSVGRLFSEGEPLYEGKRFDFWTRKRECRL